MMAKLLTNSKHYGSCTHSTVYYRGKLKTKVLVFTRGSTTFYERDSEPKGKLYQKSLTWKQLIWKFNSFIKKF